MNEELKLNLYFLAITGYLAIAWNTKQYWMAGLLLGVLVSRSGFFD